MYSFFFKFIFSTLGLSCCARAFSSCGEQGLPFDAVHVLLTAAASPIADHRLQARRPQ